MVDLSTPIEQAPLSVVDVETTGLDPTRGDRVIEVALLGIQQGEVRVEWQRLVNPQRAVSWGAYRVNHISDEMLADAPMFAEIADELLSHLHGTVFVGHNALFDLAFIKAELQLAQRPFPSLVAVDTLRLARRNVSSGDYSLRALCTRYGINMDNAHRAADDAWATYRLLQELVSRLARRGVRTVADLIQAQGGILRERGEGALRVPAPLREAMRRNKLLRLSYRDGYGGISERVVRPIQLADRFGTLYLVAYCYLRHGRRTFSVERIQSMTVLDEPAPLEE
ncbi:MAG: exonuclease domain-containing protein [Anaerolineae bacterium]|jgi:DNA polymerase-3 subunit epsilon|nr:WYL domain-containing protein [Chloroflexota bacterium]